jgi:ribosome recycling factor
MPLIQLAAISAPEPNLLLVKPWDKTNIKPISQVLQAADLGATVGVDDDLLRIRFSPLTEERRLELVKKLKEKTETTKVKIRGLRDKIREATVKAGADGEISEDEKYRRLEEIDKGTKEANEKIKTIADKKEAEIMSI